MLSTSKNFSEVRSCEGAIAGLISGGPRFGGPSFHLEKMEVRLVCPTGKIELKTYSLNPEKALHKGRRERKTILLSNRH